MIIILTLHKNGYRTLAYSNIAYAHRWAGIRPAGAPTPPPVTVKAHPENSAKFYKGFSLN